MRSWLEKWGSVLLIFFCAAVIVFSALYTRQDDLMRIAAQNAAARQDESLQEAQVLRFRAPVHGEPTQTFIGAYQDAAGIWRMDPFVHYAVQKGENIFACCSGSISTAANGTITIESGDELIIKLYGHFLPCSAPGDAVSPDTVIAKAARTGEILLSLQKAGEYADPLSYFTP